MLTKINKNVSDVTEIIFRFGRFDFLGAKNNVFGALGFVGCVISDSRHPWRRKLKNHKKSAKLIHWFDFHKQDENTSEVVITTTKSPDQDKDDEDVLKHKLKTKEQVHNGLKTGKIQFI